MFSYDISDVLRKKIDKLAKKDKVLAEIFFKKVKEIISSDSVDMYKNLKSPMNNFKRIPLTDNYILLFVRRTYYFYWDYVYKKD
jgi:mRNA-degrading endonuclease RelE of RelBE toxin-antitoxin system